MGLKLPLAKSIAWRAEIAQKLALKALNPDLNRLLAGLFGIWGVLW
jgi:hypothetical protein